MTRDDDSTQKAKGRSKSTRKAPLVDLNVATAEQLGKQVIGLGAALAERIAKFRQTHGPFAAVDDLLSVPGIGARKLATLAPQLRVRGQKRKRRARPARPAVQRMPARQRPAANEPPLQPAPPTVDGAVAPSVDPLATPVVGGPASRPIQARPAEPEPPSTTRQSEPPCGDQALAPEDCPGPPDEALGDAPAAALDWLLRPDGPLAAKSTPPAVDEAGSAEADDERSPADSGSEKERCNSDPFQASVASDPFGQATAPKPERRRAPRGVKWLVTLAAAVAISAAAAWVGVYPAQAGDGTEMAETIAALDACQAASNQRVTEALQLAQQLERRIAALQERGQESHRCEQATAQELEQLGVEVSDLRRALDATRLSVSAHRERLRGLASPQSTIDALSAELDCSACEVGQRLGSSRRSKAMTVLGLK